MAELRRVWVANPCTHDRCAVLDTIGYVTRYGIE